MLRAVCAAICVGLALAGNAWAGEPVKMWQSYVDGESSFDSFKNWFIERDCADQQAVKTACLSEVAYDKARQLGHFSFIPNDFWGKGDTASPEGLKFVELYTDRFREINRLSGETISYTGFLDLGKNYGFILVPESDLPVLQQAVTSALAIDRLKKEIETATVHAVELRYTNLLEAQEQRFNQILAGLKDRIDAVETKAENNRAAIFDEGGINDRLEVMDTAVKDLKAVADETSAALVETGAAIETAQASADDANENLKWLGQLTKLTFALAVLGTIVAIVAVLILVIRKPSQRALSRKARQIKTLSAAVRALRGEVIEIKNSARKTTAADTTAGEAQTSSDAGEVRQTTIPAVSAETANQTRPTQSQRTESAKQSRSKSKRVKKSEQGVAVDDSLRTALEALKPGESHDQKFLVPGKGDVTIRFRRKDPNEKGRAMVQVDGIKHQKAPMRIDTIVEKLAAVVPDRWSGASVRPTLVAINGGQ